MRALETGPGLEHDPAVFGLVTLIGAWFVATAAVWNRTLAGRVHAIVVGLVCFGIGLLAYRHPIARWLHVPLALWLFASAWIIPYDRPYAVWNNVALGACLFLLPFTVSAYRGEPES